MLIDRFLEHALELDVDVVTDGEDVWLAGLMEQIEEAGVHSGDSACVLPPVSLSDRMVARIEKAVASLVRAMGAVGLVNIQMAIRANEIYVLEANPRASRTVPYCQQGNWHPGGQGGGQGASVGRKLEICSRRIGRTL